MEPIIERKLEKLFRTIPTSPDISTLTDRTCQDCGQGPIICVYADLGMTDFYDNYVHLCLNPNCDFVLHHESYTGNVGGRPDTEEGRCWFCERTVQLTF
ncbi:MAG: hypothetical protein KA054_00500 [Candidatus Moranbacteria bacterium]|nr:hypothetical protein [Candidatus Moranbacteria bacterium]